MTQNGGKMREDKDDWCGKHNGKYIDLTWRYDDTWSFFYDGKRIESGIKTKKEALSKLLKFIGEYGEISHTNQ